MKRILISFLMLCAFALQVWAQSTQLVQIREYRQKQQKTPLEGVSLTVQNAGSAMSNAQGNLTLQFRSLKAGDQVQVRRVDLSGYEIFNKDAVDQWTISPQQTFSLVLCKSERFKALRDQYMRVSSASYERQYKQDQARLETLKKENKLKEAEYQEQLQQLEDNYYEQLDNLENYVDRFARIDLSEIGEQEQRIIELVQEGNIDDAVRLYESGDYLGKYQSQVKDIQEIDRAQARLAQIEAEKLAARDNLYAAINRQVQVYQLAGGRENWEKVDALLKGVADADTTNTDALFAYADHAYSQENYEDSEKYINIYLRQCQGDAHNCWQANYFLGTQYVNLFDFERAEDYLQKAVRMSDNEKSRIISLSYLHSFYWFTEAFDKMDAIYGALQEILPGYNEQNGNLMWVEASRADAERAIIVLQKDYDLAAANSLIASAYQLANEYKESDGYISLQKYAELLGTIIMAYESVEHLDLEVPYLSEQIQIYESLYSQNPRSYAKSLFEGYNNMADNLISLKNLDDSKPFLDKGLAMIPELEKDYGSSICINLMGFYDTLANYYEMQGDTHNTREYAARCMSAFSQMPVEMQEVYQEVKQHWIK